MKVETIINALLVVIIFPISVMARDVKTMEMTFTEMDTTEVLAMAETMPEIIGGIQEVYKHIDYPRQAILGGVEGRVFVKFIVDENGNVKKPVVLRDIGAGCGEAAVKGISKVKFKPAMNDGKPVSVYYTLPITFKIQN